MTPRPYAAWLAGAVALAALTACTPIAEQAAPDDEASPSASPFSAPELDDGRRGGPDEGSAGGAPSFEGRLPLRLSDARREVVTEPCTANQIERLCGSSAQFEIEPVGQATDVTLRRATTRPAPDGLTWTVRLRFDRTDAPLPPAPGGRLVQVLDDRDGLQLELGPDARVRGQDVVLAGYDKRRAWALVDQVAGSIQ